MTIVASRPGGKDLHCVLLDFQAEVTACFRYVAIQSSNHERMVRFCSTHRVLAGHRAKVVIREHGELVSRNQMICRYRDDNRPL